MQLCVTPGGKEIQVELIFKGTAGSDFAWATRPRGTPVYLPDGVTKTPHECDMWDPSVFVKFNTCAWADPLYNATWVEESFCGFVNGSYGVEGVDRSEENLLLCDNLVGQIEVETHKTGGPFKVKAMAKGNTLVWNLCVPPQGVHVALAFSAVFRWFRSFWPFSGQLVAVFGRFWSFSTGFGRFRPFSKSPVLWCGCMGWHVA